MRFECATIDFYTKKQKSLSHDLLELSLKGDPPKTKKLPVDEVAIKDLLKQLFRAYPEVAFEEGIVPSGVRPERAQGEGGRHLTVIQNGEPKVELSATEDTKQKLLIRLICADKTRAGTTWQEEFGAEYRRG